MHSPNPFFSRQAKQYSCYLRPGEQEARLAYHKTSKQGKKKQEALAQLHSFIQEETYPCLAAKASFNTEAYRAGLYPLLGSDQATSGLCYDLYTFIQERAEIGSQFTSFMAIFESPTPENELEFEQLLWRQLGLLDKQNKQFFSWNKEVSANPESADFSFSFGGQAFFVIGMHPKASRLARRFPFPMLVFNPHEQFETLKEQGLYTGMKEQIRKRDKALQGTINPMAEDYGAASEARQYAGRKVGPSWKCPFKK